MRERDKVSAKFEHIQPNAFNNAHLRELFGIKWDLLFILG
jgi:hypothetical protein